tara:strand:- start:1233 stop:1427 length:195 start_codon:yes stop_codon:yes gene_type:complete
MSTVESLTNHLKHLEELHRKLDEKITDDWKHHVTGTGQEKLEKLVLKREIEELKIKIEEKKNGN